MPHSPRDARNGITVARGTRLVILIAALAVSGCGPPRFLARDRSRRELQLSRKPVAGKEAPTTLIARDGSRCIVTEKRFAEIREGQSIWCDWRGRVRP